MSTTRTAATRHIDGLNTLRPVAAARALLLVGIAALTAAVDLLVEAPFHRPARRFGRRMARPRGLVTPVTGASGLA